jgi:hypothetical protein
MPSRLSPPVIGALTLGNSHIRARSRSARVGFGNLPRALPPPQEHLPAVVIVVVVVIVIVTLIIMIAQAVAVITVIIILLRPTIQSRIRQAISL